MIGNIHTEKKMFRKAEWHIKRAAKGVPVSMPLPGSNASVARMKITNMRDRVQLLMGTSMDFLPSGTMRFLGNCF